MENIHTVESYVKTTIDETVAMLIVERVNAAIESQHDHSLYSFIDDHHKQRIVRNISLGVEDNKFIFYVLMHDNIVIASLSSGELKSERPSSEGLFDLIYSVYNDVLKECISQRVAQIKDNISGIQASLNDTRKFPKGTAWITTNCGLFVVTGESISTETLIRQIHGISARSLTPVLLSPDKIMYQVDVSK